MYQSIKSKDFIKISQIIAEAQEKIQKINMRVVLEVSFQPLPKCDMLKLVDAIYQHFNFPRNDSSKKEIYVFPRMAVMYYLKNDRDCGLKDIGQIFGGKDHSTVFHAVSTYQGYLDTNQFDSNEMIEKIRFFIQNNS